MNDDLRPGYEALPQLPANHTALTPLTFLPRAAAIYPDRVATRYGERTWTWAETWDRCCRLARALRSWGIGAGDTVSILATNTPPMFEAHFGVPASGAPGIMRCATLPASLSAQSSA